jgi:Ca2+-binding EF-hand superfamily protein
MLSVPEFKQAFRRLNIILSNEEIRELISALDQDGDGQVSYEEFLRMCGKDIFGLIFTPEQLEEQLRKTFALFDKDRSGYIDEGELEYVFKCLGRPFDPKSAKSVLAKFDEDKDGKISFEEFKVLIN